MPCIMYILELAHAGCRTLSFQFWALASFTTVLPKFAFDWIYRHIITILGFHRTITMNCDCEVWNSMLMKGMSWKIWAWFSKMIIPYWHYRPNSDKYFNEKRNKKQNIHFIDQTEKEKLFVWNFITQGSNWTMS